MVIGSFVNMFITAWISCILTITRNFFSLFWLQNRTKKGREFPEVTGQDLKEQRKSNTRFKEDVCKHVRKRSPEVELTGRGSWDTAEGESRCACFSSRGLAGRAWGEVLPSGSTWGYTASWWHLQGHSGTGSQILLNPWHLFLHSLSPGPFILGLFSHWMYSFHSCIATILFSS